MLGRGWKRWLAGAGAAVAVLAVGGPFVYIHFVEGKAPAPLSIAKSANSCDRDVPGTADGTWKAGAGSEAGYRVGETIVGQRTVVAGRTGHVTGSIDIAGAAAATGSFSVDMKTVASDNGQRDSDVNSTIMDTDSYPTATFAFTQPIEFGSLPAACEPITAHAAGKLTLRGRTKAVAFDVSAVRSGSTIKVSGSIPVDFPDYGIPHQSAAGSIAVDNHGTVEFLLVFTKA